jgi:acetolactate synthase-1/2/3 large subunit
MGKASDSSRRAFLKSSVLLGAASAAAPPLAQAQADRPAAKLPGPGDSQAAAETRPVAETSGELVANPGSDFMVDLIKAVGIDYVAAMPGSTFRGLHESIVNYGGNRSPELIVCTHEEISAAIAHGYAKVAGKPMACLVHATVGLQHASMAIYNAWCDRAPMMVIAGNGLDATHRRPGVEWVHSAQDLGALVREYVKYDDAPASLQHYGDSFMRAYEVSMTPPYEPVLIVADSDLQEEPVHDLDKAFVPRRAPVAPPAGDPAAVAKAAQWLVQAQNPVIVADRSARSQEGVDLLVRLAEALNAPVIDLGGRMNMPTPHYLNLTSQRAELVAAADVILGLELTDLWGVVNGMADKVVRRPRRVAKADAKVIGISANYGYIRSVVQDAQRYYAADLAIDADAQACLPQLIEAVERALTPDRRAAVAARTEGLKQRHARMRAADAADAAQGWDASPISTARLSMELWEQIKDLDWGLVSSHVFISGWPQRLWDMTRHHHYIGAEGGYGVGYGAPAAVGAAIAHRDAGRIAVAIQTDGDLMCQPGVFWTLAHHSIPLLMVMHNNRAWHQETMHLKRMSGRRQRDPTTWSIGTTISDPAIDFAAMARSMGVWAEGPIDDPKALPGAIARALKVVKSGKPALLDTLTQMR